MDPHGVRSLRHGQLLVRPLGVRVGSQGPLRRTGEPHERRRAGQEQAQRDGAGTVSPGDREADRAAQHVHPRARAAAQGPGPEVQPPHRHVRASAAQRGRTAARRGQVSGVSGIGAAASRRHRGRARHRKRAGLDRAEESRQPAAVKPLVIAHRGASSIALENSLAAFRAAAGQGADGVELDVHASIDGEIVVHHDPSVLGLPIAQARWRDLATAPLANGEPIPTLAQALEVLGKLKVFVEVKVLDPRWDDRLLAVLDNGPNPGGYAVHSFALHVVRRLGQKRPTLPRGVLSEVATPNPKQTLEDASAQTLWQERTTLDEALVKTVRGLGGGIFIWTEDDTDGMP